MRKTSIALAVLATLGAASAAGAASAETMKTMKPADLTCKELAETKIDYVPQIVYWLDGFDSHGRAVVEVDRDWFAVPVTEIVDACKKAPDKKAIDVVRNYHMHHHGK